jgi:hydrogenase-4 component B
LPFSTPFVLAGCCAAAALPPLTGFASEWLVFAGFIRMLATAPALLQAAIAVAIGILAVASGLAALAFAKLFGIAFLGESRTTHEPARERPDAAALGLAWLALACVAFGLAPALVIEPLRAVAASITGATGGEVASLPAPPVALAALPLLGAAFALVLGRRRGIRFAPTWTCGSLVTPRSQYTATAFSKPIRRIFGFVLFPERQKVSDFGTSRWFPTLIRYQVTTRYLVDEGASNVAAFVQRLARRARIVQAGRLRIYLVYAVVAVLVVLVVAR